MSFFDSELFFGGIAPIAIPSAIANQNSGPDYETYVNSQFDLAAAFVLQGDSPHIFNSGYDLDRNGKISRAEYGQFHYEQFGRSEGRVLPVFGQEELAPPLDLAVEIEPVISEVLPSFVAVQPAMEEFQNDAPLPPPVFVPSQGIQIEQVQVESSLTEDLSEEFSIDANAPTLGVFNAPVTEPRAISLPVEISPQSSEILIVPTVAPFQQNISTPRALDNFSNVDLGLIGAGVASTVLIGAIALVRRF